MDDYIRETKQRLSEVMGKLGWNSKDLKSAQTYSVCRYDDKHHVPRQDLVKHELLCSLKKQGLTSAEAETAHDTGFCYAESRSVASFSLTHSEIKNVLMSRCTSDRYSLEDLNVHRLLTPAERLALYEYLIEKARFEGKVHNIPEHQLLFLDNEEEKEAAQAGLTLGQLRDLKRRRPSYRAKNVHVTKKSYTERMREVLDNQFKMLEDIRKDPELLALYKKRMAARASSVQPQPNSEASAQRERSESRSRVPEKVSVDDKWQHDKFDPSEGLRDRRSMSRQCDRRHSGEFDPRDPRNARSESRDGRDFRTDYRDRSRDPARGSQSRDSAPRDPRESAPPRDHREISRDHRSASRDGSRGDERSRGYEDARGSSSRGHSASRYEQKMAADEFDDRMAPRDYQRSTSRDHHERSSRDRSSSRVRSHVEVRTEYDVPRSRSRTRTRSRSHRSDSKHKKRKKESKSRERSVKKKKKKLSDKKSRKRKHRHEEREKRKSKKEKRKHKHKKAKRRKLEEEDEFEEEMSSDEEVSDDSDVDSDDVTSDVDDSDDEDVSVSEEENSEEAESEEADGDEEEKEDLSEEEQEEEELSGSDPSLSPSD